MATIDGKFNLLQEQAFNSLAPDNEISRIRMIELMNFLNREAYQIGDVIESTLTYEQFRLVFNDTWTTMRGQSIITTDLGTKKSINFFKCQLEMIKNQLNYYKMPHIFLLKTLSWLRNT